MNLLSWALRAGYSYDKALGVIKRMRNDVGDYSSFEALSKDHPSWTERLTMLDKQQAELWRAMSAFESGVYFLQTEQYLLAEQCFLKVTKQFPDSWEAWADLGYARLMLYADALDESDLRRFGIGQIVTGGFYRRPETLEAKVRGINEELWWDAVGALRESLRRKPDLAASYANLGIAYLIRPAGLDAGKAAEYLERANELAQGDTHLDPASRVSLVINLAVAYAAGGKDDRFDQEAQQAESALKSLQEQTRSASLESRALSYNRAFRLATSEQVERRRLALEELQRYLQKSSPNSAWWNLAYERYVKLCGVLSVTPKTQDDFKSDNGVKYRPVASVQFGSSAIALGQPIKEVQAGLGTGVAFPAVADTNLMHISYPDRGIDLLANDKVLAIILTNDQHPIAVRQVGLGTKEGSLRVGMSKAEVDTVLPFYDFVALIDPENNYRFYSDLGVVARLVHGKVTELILVQMPRKQS